MAKALDVPNHGTVGIALADVAGQARKSKCGLGFQNPASQERRSCVAASPIVLVR
jgi:hypothetical protein